MSTITLVGMFDDRTQANAAVTQLQQLGVSQSHLSVTSQDPSSGYRAYQGSLDSDRGRELGTGVGGFFSNLFGSDVSDDDRELYSEAVRRGSIVVTADLDERLVEQASDVFTRNGAIDIDRRGAQYKASGYEGFDESAPPYTTDQTRSELQAFGAQGEVALPVIEEQLKVGKRSVQRGGIRIHTRMTERPVEEHITLRDEQVHVDRRAVDREATAADLAGMRDGVIEVTETDEEAVVSKQARVVEEVVVGRDVVERDETFHETVRRTDVDVETVGADSTPRKGARK